MVVKGKCCFKGIFWKTASKQTEDYSAVLPGKWVSSSFCGK
jgi:hypothetical protein